MRVILHQAGPHLPHSAADAAPDPGPARHRPAFASPSLAEPCRWLVFPGFEPAGRDLDVPGPADVAATDPEPLPGRAEAHPLTHDSASCHPAPTAACGPTSRWAQPTAFNARFRADRRPYRRAQKLVSTSTMSRTRSSATSPLSSTTSRLPCAESADSTSSAVRRKAW